MRKDLVELRLLQGEIQMANQRVLAHVTEADDMVQQRCELLKLATERIREGLNDGLVSISQPVYLYPMFVLSESGSELVADRETTMLNLQVSLAEFILLA